MAASKSKHTLKLDSISHLKEENARLTKTLAEMFHQQAETVEDSTSDNQDLTSEEMVAGLKYQLSEALETNRYWLKYDQQREAYLRAVLDQMSQLRKICSKVNVRLYWRRIIVGTTYLVIIVSQNWCEQLELKVEKLKQSTTMREESAKIKASEERDQDDSEHDSATSDEEEELGQTKEHLQCVIQEVENNIDMLTGQFAVIRDHQINPEDKSPGLKMMIDETMEALQSTHLKEEPAQEEPGAQEDDETTTSVTTDDLKMYFESLLEVTECDSDRLREETEEAERALTHSMFKCFDLKMKVEQLVQQVQREDMSEESEEEGQSKQESCENECEEQPVKDEPSYRQVKLNHENFELQGDQQDVPTSEDESTLSSRETLSPDMSFVTWLECPICQSKHISISYKSLLEHIQPCIFDTLMYLK